MRIENKIFDQLCEWGVCEKESIELFYPKVRDRDDISVFKCKCDALFTSTTKQARITNFQTSKELNFPDSKSREEDLAVSYNDNVRRKELIQNSVSNKKWLDVGTGNGGILDLLKNFPEKMVAVEPKQILIDMLSQEGYEVYPEIKDVPYDDFDVVTLFHVFEHLENPLETLQTIRSKMKNGGKIIIEVPHANDFLMSFLNLESFKAFTLWSEHLILHTRQTLKPFIEKAGFKKITIKGLQRYNLANHLYWLKNNKPGGHEKWKTLSAKDLDSAYSSLLQSLDMTDTLVAFAEK